jgi:hypothetical protein
MQGEGNQIRIRFSSLGSGLLVKDKYWYGRGFEITAADGKFTWAQSRQYGREIVVFNESIPQPVAVRYDRSNTPDGNLFNQEGLRAVPFRTDPELNPKSGKGGDPPPTGCVDLATRYFSSIDDPAISSGNAQRVTVLCARRSGSTLLPRRCPTHCQGWRPTPRHLH